MNPDTQEKKKGGRPRLRTREHHLERMRETARGYARDVRDMRALRELPFFGLDVMCAELMAKTGVEFTCDDVMAALGPMLEAKNERQEAAA